MRKIAAAAFIALALAGLPARAADIQLPNLVPYPAGNITIARADDFQQQALRFDTRTANLGDFHFQLTGGAPNVGGTESDARQCVRWSGRVCLEDRVVGTFDLHLNHRHWHLNGYARYELRHLDESGQPDMSPAGLVVDGGKVSFCLLDVSRTDSAPEFPEDPFASSGFYTGCLGVIQGISRGWADIYGRGLTGQQIVVDGVPDGRYAIVITIDPDGFLLETTHADNVSWRAIELSKKATTVTVL